MPDVGTLAPLPRLDLPAINAHIRELNARLRRISEALDKTQRRLTLTGDLDAGGHRLTNVGTAQSDDDALPLGQLESELEALESRLRADLTSEAEEDGSTTSDGTSTGRGDDADDITAQLDEAAATVAPPKVDDASALGTTTDPLRFALEDHTHQGVNLDEAQIITGAKTFDRDPAAPYVVTSGSDAVENLGAEWARRALLAMPQAAGLATSRRPVAGEYGTSTDVAKITVDSTGRVTAIANEPIAGVGVEFKRTFLLMGA